VKKGEVPSVEMKSTACVEVPKTQVDSSVAVHGPEAIVLRQGWACLAVHGAEVVFCFHLLVVLGFELRTLCLLGRFSIMPPVPPL
jgi:hypothetical protein